MALDFIKIMKGFLVKNQSNRNSELVVQAGSSSGRTTLVSNQTSNITVTLPNTTSTLATDAQVQAIINEKGVANGIATLDVSGKVPSSQLPVSAMEWKGNWDASTNTPTLTYPMVSASTGDVYRVNVAGTQNLGEGLKAYVIGDWVVYNGSIWELAAAPGSVHSVNAMVGDVILTKSNVGLGNVDNTSDLNKPISTATQTALTTLDNAKINLSTVTTKGDLIAATSSGVVTRLPVGNNKQILVADSTQASGIKWSYTTIPVIVASGLGTTQTVTALGSAGLHLATYDSLITPDNTFFQLNTGNWKIELNKDGIYDINLHLNYAFSAISGTNSATVYINLYINGNTPVDTKSFNISAPNDALDKATNLYCVFYGDSTYWGGPLSIGITISSNSSPSDFLIRPQTKANVKYLGK